MRMRQGAWGVAAVAVIVFASAGCTGPTTPDASPTTRSTVPTDPATATQGAPTPTALAEPVPTPEMAAPSVDGAVAAARYFLELYTYSMASGDLNAWRAMSADDCKMCNSVIAEVEELVAIGHTVSSDPLNAPTAVGMEVTPGELYGADLDVTQGAWTEIDRAGTVVDSGPASAVYMQFAIAWGADGWTVRQVDVHEPRPTQ